MLGPPADPEAADGDYDIPDLTGATVKLIYTVGSTKYARPCTVTDVGKALCRWDVLPADLAVLAGPATYKARARAYWPDGSKLTFPNKRGAYISLIVAESPE